MIKSQALRNNEAYVTQQWIYLPKRPRTPVLHRIFDTIVSIVYMKTLDLVWPDSKDIIGERVELRIRNLNEATHRAAKMLAARRGISLNEFILDAIQAHALHVAQKDGVVDPVIKEIKKLAPASRRAARR